MFGNKRLKAHGALKAFYDVPQPEAGASLSTVPLLAIDVETTGLDAKKHQMISIGWVPINGRIIDFSGAGYAVIRGNEGFKVGSSAVIHQLTDDEIAAGIAPGEALTRVLKALEGRVLLAHFASIEQGFLSAATQEHFGAPLEVPTVDTFTLERRHMERMSTYPRGEDLRLARVRQRYGLPPYSNHQALTDALACAEVYLVQTLQGSVETLKDVME